MSELPQPAEPDLHAIFGIDGEPLETGDPVISVERPDTDPVVTPEQPPGGEGYDAFGTAGDQSLGASPIELDEVEDGDGWGAEAPGAPGEPGEGEAGWTGITQPSRRGSSSRFLTDVIVEMGLASKRQVDDAVETSRNAGVPPERILVDQGAITNDGLARALAERYGLDHLDLGVFQVDMSAANLVSTTVAKRYQAVPVGFADKRTLLVAMADPSNVLAVDDIAIMTGHEVRVAVAPPDDIAALISRLDRLEDVVGSPEEVAEEEDSRGRRAPRELRGRPRHQARQPDRRSGRRAGRLRHPLRPRRPRGASALPHRRRAAGHHRRCPGGWPPGPSRA